MGRSSLQLFCLPLMKFLRYVSIQRFILSLCPSVRGWKAVLRFCLMPVALHTALVKCPVNLGSLSEMMRLGVPNRGRRWRRYRVAMPSPSMVLLQGRNLAALEHPWSTMVRMASYLPDLGRSVMRSIEIYWNGPFSAWVSKGCRGAFPMLFRTLVSWQVGHPLTYASVNCRNLGPW